MLKIDSFKSNLISFKKSNKSIDINIINFILCISMMFSLPWNLHFIKLKDLFAQTTTTDMTWHAERKNYQTRRSQTIDESANLRLSVRLRDVEKDVKTHGCQPQNRGILPPKMDGENNPTETLLKWMIWGGKNPIFWKHPHVSTQFQTWPCPYHLNFNGSISSDGGWIDFHIWLFKRFSHLP